MSDSPFWVAARESARAVQAGPAWMRAGIRLSPKHFETWPAEPREVPREAGSGQPGPGSAV